MKYTLYDLINLFPPVLRVVLGVLLSMSAPLFLLVSNGGHITAQALAYVLYSGVVGHTLVKTDSGKEETNDTTADSKTKA